MGALKIPSHEKEDPVFLHGQHCSSSAAIMQNHGIAGYGIAQIR